MTADPTAIPINFDPLRRRMVGVAHHGNTPFDCPYISHITGNLYTGGCTNGLILPHEIKHVISLYPWETYEYHEGVRSLLQVYMYDSLEQSMGQVRGIAEWVKSCMKDGPTLVHCQAGLNRSGLVAATALCLADSALPGVEAISLLREKRSPAVLCNPAFAEWLDDTFPVMCERRIVA